MFRLFEKAPGFYEKARDCAKQVNGFINACAVVLVGNRDIKHLSS
jgi:hypothetical protein